MKKAAFIMATHYRPATLAAVLLHIARQTPARGWEYCAYVAGHSPDPGRVVVDLATAGDASRRYRGAHWVEVDSHRPGPKWNACLKSAAAWGAEVVLLCGDDDLSPPGRLGAVVEAIEGGAAWVGARAVRFVNLASGAVAAWTGPPQNTGCALSYRVDALQAVGGWPDMPRGVDGQIAFQLEAAHGPPVEMPAAVGLGVTCLQHGRNLWRRAFPAAGEVVPGGPGGYTQVGEGHHSAVLSPATVNTINHLMGRPPAPLPLLGVAIEAPNAAVARDILASVHNLTPADGWRVEPILMGIPSTPIHDLALEFGVTFLTGNANTDDLCRWLMASQSYQAVTSIKSPIPPNWFVQIVDNLDD